MTSLGQRFQNGLRPATVFQISTELGIPSRLTQSVLRTLAHTQLVTEVAGVESAFVPARPLDTINAYDILLALRTGTGQELPLRDEPALAEIYGEFTRIEKAEREAASTISLLALANRVPRRVALAEPKTIEAEEKLPEVEIISEPEKTAPAATILPVENFSGPPAGKVKVAAETAKPVEKISVHREVIMPEENREFPL